MGLIVEVVLSHEGIKTSDISWGDKFFILTNNFLPAEQPPTAESMK